MCAKSPGAPEPLEEVYAEFQRAILPYATGNTHPGFLGWVHGGGTAIGMLAEMLAGGLNANLWRAPSGYYYPWGIGNTGYQQIVYVDQSGGRAQTVAQQPPLSMQFTDMGQFLDDAHKNGKLAENDWVSMKRRLKDIQSKERSYRLAGDGYLEDNYDAEIRKDLKDFSREMVERVKL